MLNLRRAMSGTQAVKRELAEQDNGDEHPSKRAKVEQPAEAPVKQEQNLPDDDDDDKPVLGTTRVGNRTRKGAECPYLDSVSRQVRRCYPLLTHTPCAEPRL